MCSFYRCTSRCDQCVLYPARALSFEDKAALVSSPPNTHPQHPSAATFFQLHNISDDVALLIPIPTHKPPPPPRTTIAYAIANQLQTSRPGLTWVMTPASKGVENYDTAVKEVRSWLQIAVAAIAAAETPVLVHCSASYSPTTTAAPPLHFHACSVNVSGSFIFAQQR